MSKEDQAMSNLRAAREKAALGAGFAPEYIEVKGQRVYYKTFSHAWVIPAVMAKYPALDNFSRGILVIYVLMQDPETVRNRIMQELEEGNIMDRALKFFEERQILPEDLESMDTDKLMASPYAKN